MSARTITGEATVLVTSYTGFDPADPTKTPAHQFSFLRPDLMADKDSFERHWAKDGYVHVGKATITIELMDREAMTAGAVSALRAENQAVLAKAEQEANRIEQRIQSLLALTMDEAAA